MDNLSWIHRTIIPPLQAMGYELVRIQFGGGRPVLQIMAERIDRIAMTINDCARISQTVSVLLDVKSSIPSTYVLEVSSPGIDRPLTRLDDFSRFAGFEVRIETRSPIEGRKRFYGRLEGVEGNSIRLRLASGVNAKSGNADVSQAVSLPFILINKAKLVLTDELIAVKHGKE